jgi:hypothetical protein
MRRASDSERDLQFDSRSNIGDEIESTLQNLIASGRFDHYESHNEKLQNEFHKRVEPLTVRFGPLRARFVYFYVQEQTRWRMGTRVYRLELFIGGLFTLFALVLGFGSLFLKHPISEVIGAGWVSRAPTVIILMISLGLPLLWIGAFQWRSLNLRRSSADSTVNAAVRQYSLELEKAVEETFTAVVNDILGPQGIVAFPTHAPRLVELNTSAIVASRSMKYLRDFIESHASSAIGVAGSRGSGKTTLLRALLEDRSLAAHSVAMTAPVHYETSDFIRRLFLEIALVIDEYHGRPTERAAHRREQRVQRVRFLVALIVFYLGILLTSFGHTTAWLLDWHGGGSNGYLGAFLGTVLVLTGLGIAVYAITNSMENRETVSGPQSKRLAASAIERLNFESERSSRSKNTIDLFSKLISFEDENSLTLRSRALSPSDLTSDLRTLLKEFATENKSSRFLVVIDELDKLSQTKDLIETVNGLKDLFHLEGVHFIVSVSTDALRSFEQRGLPTRDAFDSSFDVIVGVQILSAAESLEVLAARAEGFPPLLGLFCHAWSGGLPRDLLRAARRCVELQRDTPSPLTLEALVRGVISEDLLAMVEGELRSAECATSDVGILWACRSAVLRLRKGDPLGFNEQGQPAKLDPIVLSIALGGCLVDLFHERMEAGSAWGWSIDGEMTRVAEYAAAAMASRADAGPLREEAFQSALVALGGSVRDL